MTEQQSYQTRQEEDGKLLPEIREKLIKAIEGAGFIVTGINIGTRSRTANEKPQFVFEASGGIYVTG